VEIGHVHLSVADLDRSTDYDEAGNPVLRNDPVDPHDLP
jgi:hypothetical protein